MNVVEKVSPTEVVGLVVVVMAAVGLAVERGGEDVGTFVG